MKGRKAILALAALVLLFGTVAAWAQDEYCMPLEKQIKPGVTTVKYDGIIYRFFAESPLSVRFEKIDAVRVMLHAKLLVNQPPVTPMMTVQWGDFPGVSLDLGSTGEDDFILNTETGYAEK